MSTTKQGTTESILAYNIGRGCSCMPVMLISSLGLAAMFSVVALAILLCRIKIIIMIIHLLNRLLLPIFSLAATAA